MNLKALQQLHHKWWKKGEYYTPCQENVIVDLEGFYVNVTNDDYIARLQALSTTTLYNKIEPSRFDWLYAINTELMEYLETKSEDELADIAIFCAIYLRHCYNYNLSDVLKIGPILFIEPLYSWLPNVKLSTINLFRWALTSSKIISKIEYNKTRCDHVRFGY